MMTMTTMGRECECHEWTGEEPHHKPGAWWADCGMGGTYICCDETRAECERVAAADPDIDPATFTPVMFREEEV